MKATSTALRMRGTIAFPVCDNCNVQPSPASTSAPDASYTAPDETPPDTSTDRTAQDRPCSQATAGPFSDAQMAFLRGAWKTAGYFEGYSKGYEDGRQNMKPLLELAETERDIHRGEAEAAQRTVDDERREFRRIIRDLQADLARAQR